MTSVQPVITELTFFDGDPDDPDAYAVEVTWRGYDLYAVKRRSQVWNGKEWEIEPQPSSRTAAFRKRTRFDFDTAKEWARRLIAERQETLSAVADPSHSDAGGGS